MIGRRALIQGIGALVAFALAGIALASAGDRALESAGAGTDIELRDERGPIRIKNSRSGRAVVSAREMVPGESRLGTVRVGVRGGSARLSIGLRRLHSPPGPRGGELTDALVVRLRRISGARHRLLFSGHPEDLGRIRLGRWSEDQFRQYRVRIRFQGGAVRQNRLQGAEASFAIVWQASRA